MRQYKIMYRSLLTIHMIWVLLMIASIPFIVLFEWAQIPAMFVALTTIIAWTFYDGDCPLQIWENELHAKYAPERVYGRFFSQHYAEKIFRVKIPVWVANAAMYSGMTAVVLIGILRN